jgi:NADPH:quinone reductase-like Zn-dependent oxidoreductase
VDSVLEWTGGRGADVVIDHVGPAMFEDAMKALRRGGRLVNAGATTGRSVSFDLRALYGRSISIHGAFMGSRWELDRVLTLAEDGRLKPFVDSTFPLEEARAAQDHMESSAHFGKIVLTTA